MITRFHVGIVLEEVLGRIVVAACVFVVTPSHMIREHNHPFLINVFDKALVLAALRALQFDMLTCGIFL
jgi:hypothetical protein